MASATASRKPEPPVRRAFALEPRDIAGRQPPADAETVLDRTAEVAPVVVPERRSGDVGRRVRRWLRRLFAPSVATWRFLVAQSSSSLTRRIVLLNIVGLLALVV